MKVGLVLSSPPAYSETFFNSLIRGLQLKGVEVVLFTQNNSGKFELCDQKSQLKMPNNSIKSFCVFLIRLFLNLSSHSRFFKLERKSNKSILRTLKNIYLSQHILIENVDWLHFGFATQMIEKENVAKAIGAKMAVSLRGFDINVYPLKNKECYSNLWQKVDKVHSISSYLLNEAYELGLSKNAIAKIIHPAIDLKTIKKDYKNNAPNKVLIITTVARLNWIKGLEYSIRAMNHLNVNFKYNIIGDGNIEEIERYKYLVYKNGLNNKVNFLGKMSHEETKEIIFNSDIYLQPSLNEGFCNSILEAQALETITIATRVGGIPENIIDKETGFLVEPYSEKAISNKIIEVLNMDEETKNNIIFNAKSRVEKEFSLEKQLEEFYSFYSSQI